MAVKNFRTDIKIDGDVITKGVKHNAGGAVNEYWKTNGEKGVIAGATGTGTVLDLSNVLGTNYNYGAGAVKNALTYTFVNPVINGHANVLVNAPEEPVVTGATKTEEGFTFVANKNLELVVESRDGTTARYFFLKT